MVTAATLALLAVAVLLAALAIGAAAAVLLAARHAIMAARLRRIDGRAARLLDVEPVENMQKTERNAHNPERFW